MKLRILAQRAMNEKLDEKMKDKEHRDGKGLIFLLINTCHYLVLS